MSVIKDTIDKLESEVAGDGSAVAEWERAREIDFKELRALAQERADLATIHSIEPVALMTFSFRWGYETAMAKQREQEERELGL